MNIRIVDFGQRSIIYFIIIPAMISISLALIFYMYLGSPILYERRLEFCMPESIEKACNMEGQGQHWYFFRASDIYGDLNIVITRKHHILYHTFFRPIDWNPCHHLSPDKTQIIIHADDFNQSDICHIGTVILNEQQKYLNNHPNIENKEKIVSQSSLIDEDRLPIIQYQVALKNKNDVSERVASREFMVTFSFADGAKYEDFIKIIGAMQKYDVKTYSLRDLTSSEKSAVKSLGY